MAKTSETASEVKSIAVRDEQTGSIMVAGTEFKVKEQVTVPVLKQESGETVAIKITAPILVEDQFDTKIDEETGEIIKQTFKGKINVGRVVELTSGQLFQYVFNAISASEIRNAYPDDSYVGKCFLIKKLAVVAGKRYKEVQIIEIEAN